MILVTGGAGFIGTHTCVQLLENGYGVVAVDNLVNSSKTALDRVMQITGKKPDFVQADVCDRAAVEKFFCDFDIDCVIHFAGLKAVGESVAKPLEYYSNNLLSTLVLLDVMAKHGVKNFVFSSSAMVYSGKNTVPLRETSDTGNCTNPYDWTKYMQEGILRSLCVASPDMSVVLLRYFNPIGAHESGTIGESPNGIPNNLLPYVSQVAVGRLKCLTVYGDDYDTPDGTGVRDYIHVVDLARAHILALEYVKSHTGCEVFNVGTGRGSSVLEVIHAFEKVCGKRIPYKIGPRRPGDLATVYSDVSKARDVLGFEAKYNLEKMCEDTWRWQTSNPSGYDN